MPNHVVQQFLGMACGKSLGSSDCQMKKQSQKCLSSEWDILFRDQKIRWLIKIPSHKDQAVDVSAENKNCIGCWTPADVCYSSAESLSAFCSCPGTLPDIELKGGGLINLEEEISRQSNVEMVAWLLLRAFSHIYVENQEQKA